MEPLVNFKNADSPAFFFYKHHRISLTGSEHLEKVVEGFGGTFVGKTLYTGQIIRALHLDRPDGFTLSANAFELFERLATQFVSRSYESGWSHTFEFVEFGRQSIDVVSNELAEPARSVYTETLPCELLDIRPRIVQALNEAMSTVREAIPH